MNKTKLKILRALSEKTRLEILEALSKKDRNPTELVKIVGTTQSNISQHLRILENSWLVEGRREGKSVMYSISNKEILKIFSILNKVVSGNLEKLRGEKNG